MGFWSALTTTAGVVVGAQVGFAALPITAKAAEAGIELYEKIKKEKEEKKRDGKEN